MHTVAQLCNALGQEKNLECVLVAAKVILKKVSRLGTTKSYHTEKFEYKDIT